MAATVAWYTATSARLDAVIAVSTFVWVNACWDNANACCHVVSALWHVARAAMQELFPEGVQQKFAKDRGSSKYAEN